jgi:hypothetical protein
MPTTDAVLAWLLGACCLGGVISWFPMAYFTAQYRHRLYRALYPRRPGKSLIGYFAADWSAVKWPNLPPELKGPRQAARKWMMVFFGFWAGGVAIGLLRAAFPL